MLMAIAYGLCLDQITIRICPEYFTIGHPIIVPTQDLTLIALAWGVVATWWAGLIAGLALAAASRLGSWPKRSAGSLVRPLGVLFVVMAAVAALAGVVGFVLASRNVVWLVPQLSKRLPEAAHVAFLTDLWIHSASYAVGFVGTVVLTVQIVRARRTAKRFRERERSR